MRNSDKTVNNRTFTTYFPFLADGEKFDYLGLFKKTIKFAEDYREVKEYFEQHPSEDGRVKTCLEFIEKYYGPMLILENPGNDEYKLSFQIQLFKDIPGRNFVEFTKFINNDPETVETNNLLRV